MSYVSPVFDLRFRVNHQVDLTLEKTWASPEWNWSAIDNKGNMVFRLKNHRVLYDSNGIPLLTFSPKRLSMHGTHYVYKGASTEYKDMIFIVKASSIIQLKQNIDLFLASNTEMKVPDFRIIDTYIYAGNCIVAKMHKNATKSKFGVKVYTNVDCSIIVTLLLIREEIYSGLGGGGGGEGGDGGADVGDCGGGCGGGGCGGGGGGGGC